MLNLGGKCERRIRTSDGILDRGDKLHELLAIQRHSCAHSKARLTKDVAGEVGFTCDAAVDRARKDKGGRSEEVIGGAQEVSHHRVFTQGLNGKCNV